MATFVSPGLHALISSECGGQGRRVLDLGPMRPSNLAFYGRVAKQFYIDDLHSSIVKADATHNDPLQGCLELPDHSKFDIILAWDLFDYLSPQRASELAERLAFFSHSKTVLFMMVWTSRTMPRLPNRYAVTEEGAISYEAVSSETRLPHRYNKKHIRSLLPGFSRTRSFLIASGVEEYLLRSLNTPSDPSQKQASASVSAIHRDYAVPVR